jgi:hypothetical protein
VGESFPFETRRFLARSLEISPGFVFHFGGVALSLQSRLLNFSRKDKIIFGSWIRNDEFESKKLDLNNPFGFKLNISFWM